MTHDDLMVDWDAACEGGGSGQIARLYIHNGYHRKPGSRSLTLQQSCPGTWMTAKAGLYALTYCKRFALIYSTAHWQ